MQPVSAVLKRVTGEAALDAVEAQAKQYEEKLTEAAAKSKSLEKEIQQLKDKLASQESANLANNVKDIAGVKVLVSQLNGADNKALARYG